MVYVSCVLFATDEWIVHLQAGPGSRSLQRRARRQRARPYLPRQKAGAAPWYTVRTSRPGQKACSLSVVGECWLLIVEMVDQLQLVTVFRVCSCSIIVIACLFLSPFSNVLDGIRDATPHCIVFLVISISFFIALKSFPRFSNVLEGFQDATPHCI